MPWHDDETQLGPKQTLTREGFLLCSDVPLARVGTQVYHASELPGLGQRDGWINVQRDASEVFHPASVRSFQGRPIVDEHPADFIHPGNIAEHSIGNVINVRQGRGADSDVLLGDLLFTAQRGIDLVRGGKRAVSVGYDANYARDNDGVVRQRGIICNHIALVDEGRCGSRCTIGDAAGGRKPVSAMSDEELDRMLAKWTARRRTRDAHGYFVSGNVPDGQAGSLGSSQEVGPRIVHRLTGPASSYSIGTDGAGDAVVWQHSGVTAQGEGYGGKPLPREGDMGDHPRSVGDSQARAVAVYQRMQRDAAVRLRQINQANAAFWSRR